MTFESRPKQMFINTLWGDRLYNIVSARQPSFQRYKKVGAKTSAKATTPRTVPPHKASLHPTLYTRLDTNYAHGRSRIFFRVFVFDEARHIIILFVPPPLARLDGDTSLALNVRGASHALIPIPSSYHSRRKLVSRGFLRVRGHPRRAFFNPRARLS